MRGSSKLLFSHDNLVSLDCCDELVGRVRARLVSAYLFNNVGGVPSSFFNSLRGQGPS